MKTILIDYGKSSCLLREMLEKNNFSKKDLMERLNHKSLRRINSWLDGNKLPSLEDFVNMCNLFSINMNELICYQIMEK